jgi:hypothetical protein
MFTVNKNGVMQIYSHGFNNVTAKRSVISDQARARLR